MNLPQRATSSLNTSPSFWLSIFAIGAGSLGCGDQSNNGAGDGDASTGGNGATGSGGDGSGGIGTGGDATGGAATGGNGSGGSPLSGDASAYLYNAFNDEIDPRFAALPTTLSSVELLSAQTLLFDAPEGTLSVLFSNGMTTYLDTAAPFRLTEDETGAAVGADWSVGAHTWTITHYASADGAGEPLGSASISLEITSTGTDLTPESGQHSEHKLWIAANGDYDNAAGDFAFMVLLPEGYDPAVKYPVVTFLHHGSEDYRGTDNNGLPLTTSPLFTGPRAIHSSATRLEFPAVVLIPQLPPVQTIEGITHEWASFSSLSNETGDYTPGPEPSIAGAHVFRVLDDMVSGALIVDGQVVSIDSGRVYVAGHSMGGFGTWDFLMRRPSFWAAGVPMAGYHDQDSAASLVDTPIWCFHHEIDCYNPFHVDTMLSLIEAAGGTKMRLTRLTFDTGGQCDQAHFQTPNAAWNEEPELFQWIFGQARSRD